MMDAISFRLAAPLQSPNRRKRTGNHRIDGARLSEERRLMAVEIMSQLVGIRPAEPFKYAQVRVYRHGIAPLDRDNLHAAAKQLLDLLQPPGKPHMRAGALVCPNRFGLGIIENDRESQCDFEAKNIKVRHRTEQCTMVVIRRLDAMPAQERMPEAVA